MWWRNSLPDRHLGVASELGASSFHNAETERATLSTQPQYAGIEGAVSTQVALISAQASSSSF